MLEARGRWDSRRGLRVEVASAGVRLRWWLDSRAERTGGLSYGRGEGGKRITSETVDSPLFELLEGDFGGRGCGVEIQTVRVFLHLVKRMGELFFLVVEDVAAFGVDAVAAGGGRLADHFEIETRAHSLSLSLSPVGPKRVGCFSRVERKEKVEKESKLG